MYFFPFNWLTNLILCITLKQAAGYQKTLYNSPYNGVGDTYYFGPEGKSKIVTNSVMS